ISGRGTMTILTWLRRLLRGSRVTRQSRSEYVNSIIDLTGQKTGCRVTTAAYLELEEGHRTTLVVGMIDMLECVAKSIDPRRQDEVARMLENSKEFVSGDLREMFDAYCDGVDRRERTAVASDFFSMLIERNDALRRRLH